MFLLTYGITAILINIIPGTGFMEQMVQAIKTSSDPIGFIEEIHGPVIDVACDRLPPLHQALFCICDRQYYLFEVYRHLDVNRPGFSGGFLV
jgi:F-type H+-transporting ATPase subunit beta